MRIGYKFYYKDKEFEITDIVAGVHAGGKQKTMIFYRNVKTKELKAKSAKEFLAKFCEQK